MQDTICENVSLHFKFEGRMYSIMFKRNITLLMLKARIQRKIGFVESNVQLQLSYKPLLVETVEHCELNDDEDVNVYLDSVNYEKRRCMLFVNVIPSEPQPEQVPIVPTVPTMPIVDQSSVGMNFENQHAKDGEIGPNAIVVYVGKEKAVEGDSNKEGEAESRDEGDEYTEPRPVVEPGKYIEPWDDGLDLTKLQEFPNKKALQDVVDRASFANCFSFEIVKSDKVRYVVKCPKEGCNWGLRGGRIRDTDIFSIRRHNKMHTCSRASQSSSNSKRQGTPKLVASLLHGDYPGQMETPPPKIIMDLVKTKLGVDISYSTALRGKNQAVTDLKGSPEESYKMLRCYLHMLEKVNHGTRSYVHCDENNKFMYLFIALGASIEGFKVMRKVITMDATFLKNGNKGVLKYKSQKSHG
ncbi:PREDICTED: uncharacterized protein LOC104778638 [Camelina sativa]|uniref:Uncharacterized protein LOC104778638 n=1 Tax=Camelina sativa TaxID=90675 RepID=A0ABM1R7X1_CAMSA|nr:PREDICTED: uncharacterized protein LOC104778638 [Camelina sativa]